MKENNKKLFVAESKEDIPVVNMWTPLDTKVDESYNYIPKSFLFKLFSFLLHIIAIPVLLIYNKIFFGLKIEGRMNLKDVYNSPFISVCNHVHIVDCSMVALALCKFNLYYPTLKQNVDIPGINIIVRLLGGVPIPTKVKAFNKFYEAVSEAIKGGNSVHIYPEGILSPYYNGVREFKRGAFKIAYDNNVPIVPMMITYRKSKGWRKITNKKPLLNISILNPIFPNYDIDERSAIEKMMNDCYEKMEMKSKECELNRETERAS